MVKEKHYVNNPDFTKAVVDYQKLCRKAKKDGKSQPQMPKYIGECISQICMRLTVGPQFNFISYTYLDEMQRDAIERCCYAILKFKAKKTKVGAFGYMTTVALNAMKRRIQDEKKQNYAKHKYFQSLFTQSEVEAAHKEIGHQSMDNPNEYSYKVVTEYEEAAARKAAKQILTLRAKNRKISGKRKRRKKK